MNNTTKTKFKIVRSWSIMDTREDPASVYEQAVVQDASGQLSLAKVIREPEKKTRVIIAVKNTTMEMAEETVRYLEANYCFCIELGRKGKV
jgi:hypothetical protein